jgi:hypothetical protein
VFWYRLVIVAHLAFQVCSIDHSDISPFRINNLRTRNDQDFADCDKSSNVPRSLTGFSSIAAPVPLLGGMTDARQSCCGTPPDRANEREYESFGWAGMSIDYSQRARPANPMITSAPAIASAAPNRSALVGACRSTTDSHASDAAM